MKHFHFITTSRDTKHWPWYSCLVYILFLQCFADANFPATPRTSATLCSFMRYHALLCPRSASQFGRAADDIASSQVSVCTGPVKQTETFRYSVLWFFFVYTTTHRILKAYCSILVRSFQLSLPGVSTLVTMREHPAAEGGTVGEKCPGILPKLRFSPYISGSFTCSKATTWDRRLYFPSEGRSAQEFFALKFPTALAGCEPANLGTKGQHATSRPLKKAYSVLTLSTYSYVPDILTCIFLFLRRSVEKKKSRNIVTSSHPGLIREWCNMMLEQWNLLGSLTLTLATYTHVCGRGMRKGGRRGETEQKISVEAITN